ncbi:transcriptional regulator [Helicobacter sp. 13S00477-4]|uniref:transcriptional regulator n=1 Tax=Helicobacter sp. 13S00477-4 TaxID=1905759 RepID=UPI000BA65674|nr:transcriptional regulator [Helicobacter sp. 13S00477-4]PAF50440.1 transcriptional regulator [Helicobacter sp. 13S00477-4]
MSNEQNLIKKTAKELGMTYKELGEAIGYSESAINKSATTSEVSKSMEKAIELYLETLMLKKKLSKWKSFEDIIREVSKQ